MGCNEEGLSFNDEWWGLEVDWKLTDEDAEKIQEVWETGERGFTLAAIGLAKRKAYYPAALAESLSLLCNVYADDIGDAAEGCGVEVQFHFVTGVGYIPWYEIVPQDE